MQINDFLYVSLILEIFYLPLFHKKVTYHNPLQKRNQNLARTCKNTFSENKIKPNWLHLLKKVLKRYN